jgi:hypothetical protein
MVSVYTVDIRWSYIKPFSGTGLWYKGLVVKHVGEIWLNSAKIINPGVYTALSCESRYLPAPAKVGDSGQAEMRNQFD